MTAFTEADVERASLDWFFASAEDIPGIGAQQPFGRS